MFLQHSCIVQCIDSVPRKSRSTVISYPLLNKDLIQFAHRSSKVRKMLIDGERVEAIRLYITGTKFRNITGDPELTNMPPHARDPQSWERRPI